MTVQQSEKNVSAAREPIPEGHEQPGISCSAGQCGPAEKNVIAATDRLHYNLGGKYRFTSVEEIRHMAVYKPSEHVFRAAETWKTRCLLGRGSVFMEDALWGKETFGYLKRYFVDNLDWGEGDFFQKLTAQLEPAPAAAKQLAAEIFWVMYLYVSVAAMRAETKWNQIERVWGMSGKPFPQVSPEIRAAMDGGIGHPGTAYQTHRWREFKWFILAMLQWCEIPRRRQEDLLADPWEFAQWIDDTEGSKGRQLRHILLHLLFPATFERIATRSHKVAILKANSDRLSAEYQDIDSLDRVALDRALLSLRGALEKDYGSAFDFYESEVWDTWMGSRTKSARKPATDEVVPTAPDELERWRQEHIGDHRVWLIGAGQGAYLWPEMLREKMVFIGWDYLGDLREYQTRDEIQESIISNEGGSSKRTHASLACFQFCHEMAKDDIVIVKKGVLQILAIGKITSDYDYDADRAQYQHVRGVQWLRTGPWNLPESWRVAQKVLTEFTNYVDWLRRLWDLTESKPTDEGGDNVAEETAAYGVTNALEDLFISPERYSRIVEALGRSRNVVLQGPPGVGKTYVAKRIAWTLMGRPDESRVGFVQFHQSYSYEDFVQGWRPNKSGGFELRDGIFLRFCRDAERRPGEPFVFIIDEINRANLSKVLGELMMLIEADKRSARFAIHLTYSEPDASPFFVPDNVHIIGLMNTADRSLAIVDYALRRRFSFVNLEPAFTNATFQDFLLSRGVESDLINTIIDRMSRLNEQIREDSANLGPGYEIGHSYFCPRESDDVLDRNWYDNIVTDEIAPLLREYWFDDLEKVNAIVDELRKA